MEVASIPGAAAPDRIAMTTASAFADTAAAVADVEGWMTPSQARRLWDRASEVAPGGRIGEIGCFRGRSTIVLARASAPGVDLVAIDPHAGNDRGPREIQGFAEEAAGDHEVFNANLSAAGVRERVRHVRAFSDSDRAHSAVDGDIDLLYVDGAHRYRPARADLRDWGRRVRPGGVMLVHDSFSSVGVTLALVRTTILGRGWRYMSRSESMTEYRREPLGGRDRLADVGRQVAELPWFARNLLIKALIVFRLGRLTRLLGHDPDVWPY
jgi:predicted O-methyltransferase YrrM